MATKPISSSNNMASPLLQPKGKDKDVIDPSGVAAASDVGAAAQSATQKHAKGPTASNFDVKISDGGKDKAAAYDKALTIARNTPDVREDKVADLKKRIDAGTYQIDSGKIADSMLREAVIEHLAEGDGHER